MRLTVVGFLIFAAFMAFGLPSLCAVACGTAMVFVNRLSASQGTSWIDTSPLRATQRNNSDSSTPNGAAHASTHQAKRCIAAPSSLDGMDGGGAVAGAVGAP